MKTFSEKVIQWYSVHKRPLPWRQKISPYTTWLSEIILQQTRVAQGMNYYTNITNKYKTINDLAAEEEAEILKLWQGLGYYTRARNLHATAKHLVEKNGGNFPETYAKLVQLKGIGRYTAAAIASICFGEAVPVIDGNVYRVIARCFSIDMPVPSNQAHDSFSNRLSALIDPENPGDFNQGIMELGALICTPKKPDCRRCPLQWECQARREGKTERYPIKMQKKKRRDRYFNFLLLTQQEKLLMLRRNTSDIWAGLYTFPLIESDVLRSSQELKAELQIDIPQLIGQKRHKLTHQELHIQFWFAQVDQTAYKRLQTYFKALSIPIEKAKKYAVPKPVEHILEACYPTQSKTLFF